MVQLFLNEIGAPQYLVFSFVRTLALQPGLPVADVIPLAMGHVNFKTVRRSAFS